MLKIEDLKKVDSLKGLTDEAFNAIVALSKADEDATIGPAIRKIYDQLDADILELTGVEKGSRKTYQYLKDEVGKMKDDLSDVEIYKAELNTAEKKVKDLEKQIKNNTGDTSLKEANDKLESELADQIKLVGELRSDLKAKEADIESKQIEYDEKLQEYEFKNIFNETLRGVTFKKGYDKDIINTIVEKAEKLTMSTGKPKFIEEGGKKIVNFYDENGSVMTAGAEKLRANLTARDIFVGHLGSIVEEVRAAGGGGGNGDKDPKPNTKYATKQEAIAGIRQTLADEGLVSGTKEFRAKQSEYFKDFGVGELPSS